MRNRSFGVELECNLANDPKSYYTRGEDEQWDLAEKLLKKARASSDWDIDYDGSCLEIRTPILSGGAGFTELRRVMNILVANGGATTRADGMHVHHDAPEFVEDPILCGRLVRSWEANRGLIYSFVDPYRRTHYYCPPNWNETNIRALERNAEANDYWGRQEKKVMSPVGRGALNLGSLWDHGSIEIRLHEGTLDFDKASSWIRFGQHFINSVSRRKKTPMRVHTTHQDFLKSIRVGKRDSEKLLARAGVKA